MKIYIDSEYKCHVQNDGTMKEVETDLFDGMYEEYIEGYRFIPDGETWVRSDGIEFTGEMLTVYTDYVELQTKQLAVEQEIRREMQAVFDEANNAYKNGVNSV